MNRLFVLVVVVALSASRASAQFGSVGSSAPTSSAQASMLSNASSFVSSMTGMSTTNITFTNASLSSGTVGAATSNATGPVTIGVDFGQLAGIAGPNATDGGLTGVAAVVIYHELLHRNGWGNGPCAHQSLVPLVASKNCELAGFITQNTPPPQAAAKKEVCDFFKAVQASFNAAPPVPNCPPKTPIPNCPNC